MPFSVFKNLNHFANKSKTLDVLAIFFARTVLYIMLTYLIWYAYSINQWKVFIMPFISGLFAAFVLNKIIYLLYKEKRPARLENTKLLIPIPDNPSFPSRHASLLFGISFYLFFYNPLLAIVFLICSCLVGIARVFCGVHWFHDILAGVLVGFLSALIMHSIINYIKF